MCRSGPVSFSPSDGLTTPDYRGKLEGDWEETATPALGREEGHGAAGFHPPPESAGVHAAAPAEADSSAATLRKHCVAVVRPYRPPRNWPPGASLAAQPHVKRLCTSEERVGNADADGTLGQNRADRVAEPGDPTGHAAE